MSVQIDSKKITLRSAGPDDEEFLYQVYASSRQDEMSAWGFAPAQQESFLRMQFRAQQFNYEELDEEARSIILYDDNPVGRLIVERTGTEIHLAEIALLPEYRNAGIGTGIINDLLAEAARKGIPVCLQVLKTNPAAELYKRLGFSITGDNGPHFQMKSSVSSDN